MTDYYDLICRRLLDAHRKDPSKEKYNIHVSSICKSYVDGVPYEPELFTAVRRDIERGREEGLWRASLRAPQKVYVSITATASQVSLIAQRTGLHSMAEYRQEMEKAVSAFLDSPSPQVSDWALRELTERGLRDCKAWFRPDPDTDPIQQGRQLTQLLQACETVSGLTDDILYRNLSSAVFSGSKDMERHYLPKIAQILAPDLAAERDTESILSQFHVFRNPVQILVRGEGTLRFSNGDVLHLRSQPVGLSDWYLRDLSGVESDGLLTIENLTTFHDYKLQPGQMSICTMGYPSHRVTNLISLWLRTGGHSRFRHYGDMDAFGFEILWMLHERTGAQVEPLHMDLATYEANKERSIPLLSANIAVFRRLKDKNYFSKKTEDLFDRLMQDGRMLEQESVWL